MKGVIFNILEEFVVDGWGADKYDEILQLCPLKTREPFVGPATYPDSDLTTIAAMTADTLGLPLDAALTAFGRYMFGQLAERFPVFLEGHTDMRSFLMSVDSVVHVEVRKLMKDADPPSFAFKPLPGGGLELRYKSKRKLCSLLEGLLHGAAEHFGVHVELDHPHCLRNGHDCCEYTIEFSERPRNVA